MSLSFDLGEAYQLIISTGATVVALAAKLARIAWAVLRSGNDYDRQSGVVAASNRGTVARPKGLQVVYEMA